MTDYEDTIQLAGLARDEELADQHDSANATPFTGEALCEQDIRAARSHASESGNTQLVDTCDVALTDEYYGRRGSPNRLRTQARKTVAAALNARTRRG